MISVPALVVIGGGEDGVFYVRQLSQAVTRGRLACSRVLVIDRSPDCRVAAFLRGRAPEAGPELELVVSDWGEWLADGLDSLPEGSHLVPWHWAPHLLLAWLALQVSRAGGRLQREGEVPSGCLPYDRETREGDRALSYATWACPPTCIEPALCPHTLGPKDWSLATLLSSVSPGEPFQGAIALPCLHLVWGVGTVPVAAILEARDRLLSAQGVPEPGQGSARSSLWRVSTASHCHGLSASVRLEPGPVRPG